MNKSVVGCVLLTMGTRPEELRRALDSLLMQEMVNVDVVVVGNGWDPSGFDNRVKTVFLEKNVGIPAGRNAGALRIGGEYIFFLDDDAELSKANSLSLLVDKFQDSTIGLIQPRVVDPLGGVSPKRWVPRLCVGDPFRSSPATSLWEGAVLMRRSIFDEIGGWGAPYFYAHEGIELCWRTWNAGFRAWYAADIEVWHPVINPLRHEDFWTKNSRNRVWLAKRNLPVLLVPIYLLSWVAVTSARARSFSDYRAWWRGFISGIRENPGGRKTMRWSTVWLLARAGRPPII